MVQNSSRTLTKVGSHHGQLFITTSDNFVFNPRKDTLNTKAGQLIFALVASEETKEWLPYSAE